MSTLKARKYKTIALFSFLLSAQFSYAQNDSSSTNYMLYGLIAVGAILLVAAILSIADNMMQIEAKQKGLDTEKNNFSLYPTLKGMFGAKTPAFVDGDFHNLDKGFDIKLAGKPVSDTIAEIKTSRYALMPTDFIEMSPIPKVTVEVGDEVKAGDVIFFDKKRPAIKYVSPVSGEIVDVHRGDKRAITGITILADKEMQYAKATVPATDADRQAIVNFMLENGAWPLLNQRPFDVVPDIDAEPRDVFISTFDTAPLAPDLNLAVEGNASAFQKGIDILAKLTTGKVHLGLNANSDSTPHAAFLNAANTKKHWFKGAHPAGNVGIQIHHIKPIGSDQVWTLGVQEVITLGNLFLSGEYKADRLVAIVGAELENPRYVRTYQGANIGDLLKEESLNHSHRIVSGNVLTGKTTSSNSFLHFKDSQITVMKEGDEYELLGWLLPIKPRPSMSKTFPGFLMPNHKYEANGNTHGERRAFVVTGQYEKVLPMDIHAQHLMKAIMAGNFERMEGLGIYELSEEDLALCEFVCTSKMPLQQILRDGLNMMREQS